MRSLIKKWEVQFKPARKKTKEFLDKAKKKQKEANKEALELLEFYGVDVAEFFVVKSKEEIFKAAEELGYPIVVKSLTSQVIHKEDAGAVAIDVQKKDIPQVYAKVLGNVATKMPWLTIQAILVQKMIKGKKECEIKLTRKDEKVFPFYFCFAEKREQSALKDLEIKDEKALQDLIDTYFKDWEEAEGIFAMWTNFSKIKALEVDAIFADPSWIVVDAKLWLFDS